MTWASSLMKRAAASRRATRSSESSCGRPSIGRSRIRRVMTSSSTLARSACPRRWRQSSQPLARSSTSEHSKHVPGGPRGPRRRSGGCSSVCLQVAIDLPLVDAGDVRLPLGPFRLDELLEDVLAKRVLQEVVLLEAVERLGKAARKNVDLEALLLARGHLEDVLVHGLAQIGRAHV